MTKRILIISIALLAVASSVYADTYNTTISTVSSNGSWSSDGSTDTWTPSTSGTTVSVTEIETKLNAGTSVVITTGSGAGEVGDITVSNPITKASGASATLTLRAYRNIIINSPISGSSGSPLNVILSARAFAGAVETTLGDVEINANIKTYGGDITIGGGDAAASGYAVASGVLYSVVGVNVDSGVLIDARKNSNNPIIIDATSDGTGVVNTTLPVAASGGNIAIRGKGNSTISTDINWGFAIFNSLIATGGNGTISIEGVGGLSNGNHYNVASAGIAVEGNSYIKANSGDITLTGTAGTGYDRYGIAVTGGTTNNFIGTNGKLILDGSSLLIRDGTLKVQGGATGSGIYGIEIYPPIVGCQGGSCAVSNLIASGAGDLRLHGNAQAWNTTPPTNTSATRIDNIFTASTNSVIPQSITLSQALQSFGTRTISGITTYTITYDGNGATIGSTPTDSNSPYAQGSSVTVLGTGTLAKTDNTFGGWNTLANGNGTTYQANDTFSMGTTSITLYAKWTSTVSSEPTTPASTLTFSNISNTSMTLGWTSGNGSNRIVLVKAGSAVDSPPVDGITYTANTVFGSGSQIGTNNYVVYAGSGNSVNITGLNTGTTYHFAVYEFNGTAGTEDYNTTSFATGNRSTANYLLQYNFENDLSDSSGNGKIGTGSGTISYAAGYTGQALNLTGAGWVVLPNSLLQNNSTFTISMRFKGGVGGLLGYQSNSAENSPSDTFVPILSIPPDTASATTERGKLRAELYPIGSLVSPNIVNDNNWHKVVMSITPQSFSVYLDDVFIGQQIGTVNHLSMSYNQLGTAKMRSPTGSVDVYYKYTGLIDDFIISTEYVPTVTTQAASAVTQTTATGNGTITNLGNPTLTQYGVCWSTSANPTIENSKTTQGTVGATGAFTSSITGLSAGTTYHYRAYSTNSAGTAYGADTTFTTTSAATTYTILNNDKLRFGNGNENSINNTGNLQQPLYYNNGWKTLTIGTNPLNFSIAIDGDGTNEWNLNQYILNADLNLRNLSILDDPPLTGQTIDTSGFTQTEGGLKGYGTIISTGTVNIGGKNVEIKNTYQLLQDKAYITVATRIRNVSGSSVSNIRYWVGTRDDWIGSTDGPRKEKGNLVDGAFAKITNPSERALAIKITTGSEGVLFYTDSNKANTIINSCCSWTNVINQDPQTGTIDVTGDGSYGFYVRLNDLANGASDEFTWYYAAGTITELNSIINDVASASSAVSDITHNSATLTATSDVNGTGYWIVVAKDTTAPTQDQIETAATYSGVTVASGNGAMTASVAKEFSITGLQPATEYDLYFVIKDTATPSSYSAISKSQFTTKLISPTGATATAGNASAVVSWTASSGATSYQVTGSPSGSCTATAPDTTCTVTGLTNGVAYTFTVTASNGSATSLASSPSNSVTPSDSYTVTGTARSWSGGGTVSPATQTVNAGTPATFTITPFDGSSISTVTGCVAGTLSGNTYTTGAINADCTVTATFILNSYTVTASAGAGGSITPASRTVDYGNATNFTITPDWGYELATLTYCGTPVTLPSLSGNIYKYTTSGVTANCNVVATFAPKTYTVTAIATANGKINGASQATETVTHGGTTSFTITPNTGYAINYVLGCNNDNTGGVVGNTYTTGQITGDCKVMAFFKSQ
ncbi:MAG: fibronectin type III domain-containing protein [Desulfamplus sp.]|nr:fibronectin type III domain-containing protein [Desulfamplus sp.]